MPTTTAYLIDASPYLFRAYFALPETIVDAQGRPAGATRGFIDFLLKILQREDLTHLAVAFDGSLTTSFRNDIDPAYKANRDLPPEELEQQMADCRDAAAALGGAVYVSDRYEADDLIASLCRRVRGQVDRLVVVSSDKDLAQLVADDTRLFDFARDRWYDAAAVVEAFGVRPDQVADLLALMGDSVDNIPGVAGIGKKTAVALLDAFDCLETVLSRHHEIEALPLRGAKSIRARIVAGEASARRSRRLTGLADDAIAGPIPATEIEYRGVDEDRLGCLLERLGAPALGARIRQMTRPESPPESP